MTDRKKETIIAQGNSISLSRAWEVEKLYQCTARNSNRLFLEAGLRSFGGMVPIGLQMDRFTVGFEHGLAAFWEQHAYH